MNQELWQSPLQTRYASKEMLNLFSDNTKYSIWRDLWIALAKAEQKIGLEITNEQIQDLEKNKSIIDYKRVEVLENDLKHDVMAHLHAYGELCPKAKGILHLGATSAYIVDNQDIIQLKKGLNIVQKKLGVLIELLKSFALTYKDLECLAYTHFQPAQPTTVGKRATLWLQDFVLDYEDLIFRKQKLHFLGLKGATGSQRSFLSLLGEDSQKVKTLEDLVAKELGFDNIIAVSGQTYTRKQDVQVLNVLNGIAISAHKCATDLRLLAHLKEIEEPFKKSQVGSSAMPHKQNPILSERVCSIARFNLSLSENATYTAALQWLERTLDDSANRRLTLPQAFLSIDALLELMIEIFRGIRVNENVIKQHLNEETPFLLSEEILMLGAKKGIDRQLLHEKLRQHCQTALYEIKVLQKPNNLLELIHKDPMFEPMKDSFATLLLKRLSGRSSEQVEEFIESIKGIPC
jgi:adenylosuccinate lyase